MNLFKKINVVFQSVNITKKINNLLLATIISAAVFVTAANALSVPPGATLDPNAVGSPYLGCTPGSCYIATSSASSTSFTDATVTNVLSVNNQTVSSSSIGWANIINGLFSSSATITNSTSTNIFTSALNALTAAFTSLTSSNATITNATSTNLAVTGDSTLGNATATNLFSSNASITNATTTSFFATIFNALSAVFTNLTTTNLLATNGTTTNATSTNLAVSNLQATGGSAALSSVTATNATLTMQQLQT